MDERVGGRRRRHPAWRGAGIAAAGLALFVAAAVVYSLIDAIVGSPVHEVPAAPPDLAVPVVSSPAFPVVAGALSGTELRGGHAVDVLTDRRLYERLLFDLGQARRSITLYVYFCVPGSLGSEVARILAERARAGVDVRFMGDGYACRDLFEAERTRLEDAGVHLALLRPVNWLALPRSQHRDHARTAVIDGVVGYTGGFGLGDRWIGAPPDGIPWRDTNVRFTGPAVRELQAVFLSSWAEATGELLGGEAFFPADLGPPQADVTAGLLHSTPGVGTTPVDRAFALTARGVERTLYVTNAYFVPSALVRRLLLEAVARGVDVRILVPGPRTDVASTRWAGRSYYGELLAGGVRIFEYDATMMHAKTIVADGLWSIVGSMNLDNRSTRLNDEAALLVYDRAVGATLDSIFAADVARAREIHLESHRSRPLWERFLEWGTRLVSPVL